MEQSALCVDFSDNYGSLRGLVSDNFLHAGVVGDTIVGINALSSVLRVEPQIPNSQSPSTAGLRLEFHVRSVLQYTWNASYL